MRRTRKSLATAALCALIWLAIVYVSTRPGNSSSEESVTWDDFYDFLEETYPCVVQKKYGNPGGNFYYEGSKLLCLDTGVAPAPAACTVLSFGISNNWKFDEAMERYGCKVYAFDPSLDVGDHIRGRNIHFFQLGISDSRKTVEFNNQPRLLESYRGILDKIGETESIIDYLKMDTEGAEIQFFENVLYEDADLLNNVKQIGMEIHPGRDPDRRDKLWRQIHKLRSLNFRPIFLELNLFTTFQHNGRTASHAYEITWVNDRFRQ